VVRGAAAPIYPLSSSLSSGSDFVRLMLIFILILMTASIFTHGTRHRTIPSLIESGKLKNVIPLKIYEGLDQIDEGLDYMRQGKVSAQKLAYKLY
jgi:hypothetical protein